MHERNMLWMAHDFLAYARRSLTTQTSIHHPDAGTGPGPLSPKGVNQDLSDKHIDMFKVPSSRNPSKAFQILVSKILRKRRCRYMLCLVS